MIEIVQNEEAKSVGVLSGKEEANPWKRLNYIKVNLDRKLIIFSEDRVALKIHELNVQSNSERPQFSIVVKVFGNNILIHMIANELRK